MITHNAILMNFKWIIEGRLAACRGPRNERDLSFLASRGVRALVRLSHEDETGMTPATVASAGLRDCYEPTATGSQRSTQSLISAMALRRIARRTAISCY